MRQMRLLCHTLVLSAAVGTAMPSMANAAKKAEHALSGAAHRVGQGYHKQVKDYHLRRVRRYRHRGEYGKAQRHLHKARWHGGAEHRQEHEAQNKERAVRHD
jgi:hypothetical protein